MKAPLTKQLGVRLSAETLSGLETVAYTAGCESVSVFVRPYLESLVTKNLVVLTLSDEESKSLNLIGAEYGIEVEALARLAVAQLIRKTKATGKLSVEKDGG